jgi:hypothetical protein
MVALAKSVLIDAIAKRLPELEEALEADNRLQVDRLVAHFTHNRRVTIDFLVYLRWRGIHRGQYIGNLQQDVANSLA